MSPKYPPAQPLEAKMLLCLTPQQALQWLIHPAAQWLMQQAHAKSNSTRYQRLLLTLQWDLKGSINPVTLQLHTIRTASFQQCLDPHFSNPAEVKANSDF